MCCGDASTWPFLRSHTQVSTKLTQLLEYSAKGEKADEKKLLLVFSIKYENVF